MFTLKKKYTSKRSNSQCGVDNWIQVRPPDLMAFR